MTKAELIKRLKSLQSPGAADAPTDTLQRTLHELQVHQIELEMQNRDLLEAQHELETSRQRYTDLYDFAPVGYVTLDHTGLIQEINMTGATMLGRGKFELIRKPFFLYIAEGDVEKFHNHFQRCKAQASQGKHGIGSNRLKGTPEKVTTELRIHPKDGVSCVVELSSVRFREPESGKFHYRTVIVDITERTQATVQLAQSSRLAAIGELAAGVAHEILNPLTGMMNCAEILMTRLAADSNTLRYAEMIQSEGEHITQTVRNLLDFSRQQDDFLRVDNLCSIVERSVMLLGKQFEKSNIELRLNLPEDLPTLPCRSSQLQQVIINLLVNAKDALDARYPTADTDKILSVTVAQLDAGGQAALRLTVEDHGCGIAPDQMPRLFDPFYTTKASGHGTGLGLSISQGIVEAHGGSITVESDTAGGWTRFYVNLPLQNGE